MNGKKLVGVDEICVAPFNSNDSMLMVVAANESNESNVSNLKGKEKKEFKDSKVLTEISVYFPFFSFASDDSDDDDEDGRAPQTVKEALAHEDARKKVEDKGCSGKVSKETIGNEGREAHNDAAKLTLFDSSLRREDSIGNEGGVPSMVTLTSTDPSPSSFSTGWAEGGDADSSCPSSASFMKSVELDPSARWPESLVDHAGHDQTFLQEPARNCTPY